MRIDDIVSIADIALKSLPEEIQTALAEVAVLVVDHHQDPLVAEFKPPRDFKGLFIGTQMPRAEDDDAGLPPGEVTEEGEELVAEDVVGEVSGAARLPSGTIYLNAATLQSQEEVADVLSHEIGHALGMDEEEVEALGL